MNFQYYYYFFRLKHTLVVVEHHLSIILALEDSTLKNEFLTHSPS
jgi:hypothetical protein